MDGRTDLRVGFVGLGRMGLPMAANLARAGWPLRVHNRTADKAARFAEQHRATVAETPAALAEGSDVVVSMLADAAAHDAFFRGPDGILAGLRPGAVVVEMSTLSPEGVRKQAAEVRERGADLAEAPVSGSVGAAEAGSLTILAGGEEETVARVLPVLESMGKPVYHLGPLGTGAAMKLAVNSIVYGLTQALSEALVLAERSGVPRELAYDVFANSAISAPLVHYRREEFLSPDDAAKTFLLRLAHRDLGLILAQARSAGAPMPQAEANLAWLDRLVDAGLGEENLTAGAVALRELAGAPDPAAGPTQGADT
jgi:3-hydroxyisobutyrate dehydrogenase/2-hydroxy-3-oxopropionate reductase